MSDEPTSARSPWAVELRDIMLALGLGLLGYGCWLAYPPAGFIAPGVVLSGVAIFGVR